MISGRDKRKLTKIMSTVFIAVLILVSAVIAFAERNSGYTPQYAGEGAAEVHFIDVGQGDCALILTSDKTILIDSGEYDQFSRVSRYLRSHGVEHLDYVIMSHPHTDHMGCMYKIVDKYGADGFIMPDMKEMMPENSLWTKLEEELKEQNIPILCAKPETAMDLGSDCRLEFISPCTEYEDVNNYSITVRFVCGARSFLFTGDIEREAEEDILESGQDISADVLKVPHHGSGTSGLKIFIQAVLPEYAVFSVGQANEFGHPHANVVSLYEKLGINILRTDMNGNIVFATDGSTLEVRCER